MPTFTLNGTIDAPIEVVFDVLADHRGYAAITPLRSVTLEREGEPAPNGVGAIRALKLAGPPIREEIIQYEPPTLLVYRMLSGAPISHHTGTTRLTADGSGRTRAEWVIDSSLRFALGNPVWMAVLRPVIGQLLKGVTRESERRARAS